MKWHEQYQLGHRPVSPFDEPDAPVESPTTPRAIIQSLFMTALCALGAIWSLAIFPWPVVLGSFVWGMTGLPLLFWFSVNSSDRVFAQWEEQDPEACESCRHCSTARHLRFTVLFIALSLMPATVVGVWLGEPEALTLALATFLGLIVFAWAIIFWHWPRGQPVLEPL